MRRTLLLGTPRYQSFLAITEPCGLQYIARLGRNCFQSTSGERASMFKRLFMATVTATLFWTSARADMCDGPVASVAVQSDGGLHIRQANRGHWLLCNVTANGVYGGVTVTAAACKSWQGILMSAQKTGTTLRLYTQSSACSSLGDWVTADVYFLEDLG